MRTLIVYGTKYGSAANAAELLAGELTDGADRIRLSLDDPPSLDDYDAVVIGGSIYMGKVQRSVREYCLENRTLLATRKLGFFLCCGEQNREKRGTYFRACFPPALLDMAFAIEWFGEEFSFEKASISHRIAVRMLKGVKESYSRLRKDAIGNFARTMESDVRSG